MEREIAQWVHSLKDRSDNPLHHERMLLPQSYISLPQYEVTGQLLSKQKATDMAVNTCYEC